MSIRAQIIATLQISCRSGGQASNQAARRQRLRRQAPLLPFERKLEEQKQKEVRFYVVHESNCVNREANHHFSFNNETIDR